MPIRPGKASVATGFRTKYVAAVHTLRQSRRLISSQTRVSISHHAAYRYEANFARPEEFIPERWLPNAPAEFNNDRRDVLQPFMVGPRGCIGKKYVSTTLCCRQLS